LLGAGLGSCIPAWQTQSIKEGIVLPFLAKESWMETGTENFP
jgi:hypothetical protein